MIKVLFKIINNLNNSGTNNIPNLIKIQNPNNELKQNKLNNNIIQFNNANLNKGNPL